MWSSTNRLKYMTPTPKIALFGVLLLLLAGIAKTIEIVLFVVNQRFHILQMIDLSFVVRILFIGSVLVLLVAVLECRCRSDVRNIKHSVRQSLCDPAFGNPLHLREGEIEPSVLVMKNGQEYTVRIECMSADFEAVSDLETVISGSLKNKYSAYAVVAKEEDIAGCYVDYTIKDVVSEYGKQSLYHTINDIPCDATKVYVRDDVYIDYSRVLNSSAIVSGRSRSGKTTAIISTFLLPFLKMGRDGFGSEMIIIDPKSAELSLCPHVLSPDENGNVEHILDAIRRFNQLRIMRQRTINSACKESGVPHKWFELGMHPSILFIDEFVSIQDLFPKKASKEKPDYSLSAFQGLLRQIATQGASAGCFLILSTAEASVGTGGLESAVNNACGIRVLMKPSKEEARYLWSAEKLEVVRERRYSAGDAWFSADDGINNSVRFVKFPKLEFGEYEALSKLLTAYYADEDDAHNARSAANEHCAVPSPDDEENA
ncbi:MAG: hypothetical protein IJR00_05165 [Lachnospiraceae bacterium]|nr:hypothetical protein [Lachnospiraceae bacterium]